MSVRLSTVLNDGFVVMSFAGDDWQSCRDHVAQSLGLPTDSWRTARRPETDDAQLEPALHQLDALAALDRRTVLASFAALHRPA